LSKNVMNSYVYADALFLKPRGFVPDIRLDCSEYPEDLFLIP